MKKISIGIDTSCYTTSLTAVDDNLNVLFEERIMLNVNKGSIGLRQSEAFFQHIHNVPELYHKLTRNINVGEIKNIVVSSTPRPIEGSYMPVFTSGTSFASVISDSLNIPLITISHQENHLYASLFELKRTYENFIGVHISGGTSEILKVNMSKGLKIDIIGKSLDISFGKLIDRLGVYMGLSFPCGKELDALSKTSDIIYPIKLSLKEENFNISGVENKLKELYDQNKDKSAIAKTIFEYISQILIKQISYLTSKYCISIVIMSGGVSANTIIRNNLNDYFSNTIIFSSVKYATDHAIGNAYYGNLVMTY